MFFVSKGSCFLLLLYFFLYSAQISMKVSLLINMKCQHSNLNLLAETFSCSAMLSKKHFAVVSNFRFISRTNDKRAWCIQSP